MSTDSISLHPSFLYPFSLYPPMPFIHDRSLPSQKRWQWPWNQHSPPLSAQWPFLRQYIHLWLHWPLPRVTLSQEWTADNTLSVHPGREKRQQRVEGETRSKNSNGSDTTDKVEGKGTESFNEWLLDCCFFRKACLSYTLSCKWSSPTCSLSVWGCWVWYASSEMVQINGHPNTLKRKCL